MAKMSMKAAMNKYEGSSKDDKMDKKGAKKSGMSMKAWEKSSGDKKADKKGAMALMKKGK
ncbi:hypothetical protein UFOVP55_10 [uncultured Caudovirales phage]|uniref:Uncharacterized protein n=1 Tax=uncultured Caudovirales phage TaxID=2100421 RepID=A0A6J5KUG4_9CAUD|nr:hypothetical protein UFOVP55_10 [uncultured Caudovirales phage]